MQNIQLSSSSLRSSAVRIEYPNLVTRGLFLPPFRAGRKKEEPENGVANTQGTSCRSKVMYKAMIHFYARSANCLYFQRKGPHSSRYLTLLLQGTFRPYTQIFFENFSLFFFIFPLFGDFFRHFEIICQCQK